MLQYFMTYLQTVLPQEEGQDLAEYALLIALIALLVLGAIGILTGALNTVFTNIGNTLTGAT